eukprot:TRINITY_DN3465_c0_g1_i1.p1 TRINITY_DN3465_c0_g1~~TRINITY_DN3465_c0_g1_i1.p1  ORF type:complete len:1087 (+),score=415.45 TRINITY_DN3465_c0_g1_i1:159-3419(+)
MNIADFQTLLMKFLSIDNAVRGEAEQFYVNLKQSPDALIMSLLQVMKGTQDEALRSLCAVLLRQAYARDKELLWDKASPQVRQTLATEFLSMSETEASNSIRHKLCSGIAELGAILIPEGQWQELLPYLFNRTKSENEIHREAALSIFGGLASNMGSGFKPYFNVLKDVLATGLNDPSVKVRIAALSATSSLLQTLQEPNEKNSFQDLIPAMLNTINVALQATKEEEAQSALQMFVELAEAEPLFLRPFINNVVDSMMAIVAHTNFEDATRHLAFEVLNTLAETRPGMMRKQVPQFVKKMLHLAITLMLNLDEEEVNEWNLSDDEEYEGTDYDIGEEALDRIALSMGGHVVSELFEMIPQLITNANWKHRHCALMTLAIVGEGCYKQLLPHLTDVMKLIMPTFNDPHPRVRWAACNCIGQMSTDFSPEIQTQFHQMIIPALTAVMDDAANIRVQAHSAAAIINFCEMCEASVLEPYLDGLLSKLAALLQGGKIRVQEQAITAIASIAKCAEGTFIKYYDLFVPFLKSILSGANVKEYRKLRGKAMECISLIGVAVGKEKFYNDAKEVMSYMMETQSKPLDADDPQISFMQQAWARIAKCLKQDFVPFLQYVMPGLIQLAQTKTDITIADESDETEQKDGWEYVVLGDKRVGINTTSLEEKANACNMILCYAEELEEGFFPYVDSVQKLMVPLLKFYYNDNVRQAAVSCMVPVLQSAASYLKKAGAAAGADQMYCRNLFSYMVPTFHEAMEQETELEILNGMLESYTLCMSIVGDGCMDNEQMSKCVVCMKSLIEHYEAVKEEQLDKKQSPDVDDDEGDKIDEEIMRNEDSLGLIADVLGHMAKLMKASALPILQDLLPTVLAYLQPQKTASERQAIICLIDDIVEFTQKESLPLFPYILPSYCQYANDPDPAVRQATVYGIGVLAVVGGEAFVPVIPTLLNSLNTVCSHPDARTEENVNATENAISAIAKICETYPTQVNLAQILPVWLHYLPVTEDKIESKVIYNHLCSFIEKYNGAIMANNVQNIGKVVQVLASALDTDLIDEPLTARSLAILKQIQAQLPGEIQRIWSSLSPTEQAHLQKYLA